MKTGNFGNNPQYNHFSVWRIKMGLGQWQIVSKFFTCLIKLYIRCTSDVLCSDPLLDWVTSSISILHMGKNELLFNKVDLLFYFKSKFLTIMPMLGTSKHMYKHKLTAILLNLIKTIWNIQFQTFDKVPHLILIIKSFAVV